MEEIKEDFHPLINQSSICFQMGYFEGVLHRSNKLHLLSKKLQRQNIQMDWLARVYLGGKNLPPRGQTEKVKMLKGGECSEHFLLIIEQGRIDLAPQIINKLLTIAYEQHGQLIYHHPTALLRLAEIALTKLENKEFACKIINICLNHRGIYMRIDDIQKLAEMLILLQSPVPLWADWAGIFLRHLQFSSYRPKWATEELNDQFALDWAIGEENKAEKVLRNVIESSPIDMVKLLIQLSPLMGLEPFVEVLKNGFIIERQFESIPSSDSIWFDENVMKLRYFWFDMILDSEQNFVRNGDWALFHTPTNDFSMAMAQWWRTLESILKRSLAIPLMELFLKHPEWIEMDHQNLSEKAKWNESIFLKKLTDPEKTKRLTLGELIILLGKCVSTDGSIQTHQSKLRTEASHLFYKYKRQVHPLKISNEFNPIFLNFDNVNMFRNRSSHDESIELLDASIGRFLAKRVLDNFFIPLIESYGFKARIIIPTDD